MAINYASYFDRVPKIKYDINRSLVNPKYETVTNIFFRVKVINEVLNNLDSYFVAEIEDSDTPEILAEKVYKDAGAGWIITMANRMIDPQWDWPLKYDEFNKFIVGKYGSVESALTTIHHYEMVVTRTLMPDNVTTERKYIVNGEKFTDNNLDVPYNYYTPAVGEPTPGDFGLQPGSLATTQSLSTYNIDGKTVTEIVKGRSVTNYDYEYELNESKRTIKIIKREHYEQIQSEFDTLTGTSSSYLRRVI